MNDSEKLLEAQDFISRQVQQQSSKQIDATSWGQGMIDPVVGIYRFAVYHGRERSIFAFTKDALVKNHGSEQWEKQLQAHINTILMEI